MKTTGVAVIGSGGIGTLRAHSCTQIPQVDYLAGCDTKQEKLGDLAAATNADMRTSDYEEAIRDDRVGAVFVSTDEENHHGPAALAAELGKPVLIEKPFVLDLDEADDILAKAKKRNQLNAGKTTRNAKEANFDKQKGVKKINF